MFPIPLTGPSERPHLLSASISLDTDVADVVGLIEAEELLNPILVGHGYGVVITGVAARLQARLRHLVYLDAIVPRPGERQSSRSRPGRMQ